MYVPRSSSIGYFVKGGPRSRRAMYWRELASLFTKPLRVPRPSQVHILEELRAAAWVEVLHVDEELDRQGWRLWGSRTDKDWSLVDCVSFVAMQQRGIREAMTTDRHFEQAGFLRMLS